MTREIEEKLGPRTFLEMFVEKFGPRNSCYKAENPHIKIGAYAGVEFKVVETSNTYKVEVGGIRKTFSNAWTAGRWVQKRILECGGKVES